MTNLADLMITTADRRTLLLAADGPGGRLLQQALAQEVVMLDVRAVLFSGSAAGFCRRPDGGREEVRAAYLRRLFAAGPDPDLLPR